MNLEQYRHELEGAILRELNKVIVAFGEDLPTWDVVKGPWTNGFDISIRPKGDGYLYLIDTPHENWFMVKFDVKSGLLYPDKIEWWINPKAVEPYEIYETALVGIHRLITVMKERYNASQTRVDEQDKPMA